MDIHPIASTLDYQKPHDRKPLRWISWPTLAFTAMLFWTIAILLAIVAPLVRDMSLKFAVPHSWTTELLFASSKWFGEGWRWVGLAMLPILLSVIAGLTRQERQHCDTVRKTILPAVTFSLLLIVLIRGALAQPWIAFHYMLAKPLPAFTSPMKFSQLQTLFAYIGESADLGDVTELAARSSLERNTWLSGSSTELLVITADPSIRGDNGGSDIYIVLNDTQKGGYILVGKTFGNFCRVNIDANPPTIVASSHVSAGEHMVETLKWNGQFFASIKTEDVVDKDEELSAEGTLTSGKAAILVTSP